MEKKFTADQVTMLFIRYCEQHAGDVLCKHVSGFSKFLLEKSVVPPEQEKMVEFDGLLEKMIADSDYYHIVNGIMQAYAKNLMTDIKANNKHSTNVLVDILCIGADKEFNVSMVKKMYDSLPFDKNYPTKPESIKP